MLQLDYRESGELGQLSSSLERKLQARVRTLKRFSKTLNEALKITTTVKPAMVDTFKQTPLVCEHYYLTGFTVHTTSRVG